jgi:hypothetical protein
LCDVHRERDGFEQASGDTDRLAGAGVQGGELGVVPEAAGKQIDRAELAYELVARTRQGCGIGDAQNGAGPECA